MNDWLFACIVLATIICTNIVAFFRRGENDYRAYSADPDRHGFWPIFLSMLGTIVGGGMFLAVGQVGYEAGVTGYVFGIATVIGLALVGLCAKAFRTAMAKNGVDNLVDLLSAIYSTRVALVFCLFSGGMYFFLLAGQFVAIYFFGRFAQPIATYAWLPWVLVGCGAVSMFVYPVIGGLRKDISTDIFQIVLILVACVVVAASFFATETSRTMWSSLPPNLMSGLGYGTVFLVGVFVFMPGLFLVRMDVWQRIRAAKNDKISERAMYFAGCAALLFYMLFTTLGMWARASGLEGGESATLGMLRRAIQTEWVFGLVIGAFFAAILSSADTFINVVSLFLSRLVLSATLNSKRFGESRQGTLLLSSRISAVCAVLGSGLLAWYAEDLVDLLVGAFSFLLVFLPAVLSTFVVPWRCERGAFYSAVLGGACFLTLFFAWDPKMAFAPAVLLAFGLYSAFAIAERIRSHPARAAGESSTTSD